MINACITRADYETPEPEPVVVLSKVQQRRQKRVNDRKRAADARKKAAPHAPVSPFKFTVTVTRKELRRNDWLGRENRALDKLLVDDEESVSLPLSDLFAIYEDLIDMRKPRRVAVDKRFTVKVKPVVEAVKKDDKPEVDAVKKEGKNEKESYYGKGGKGGRGRARGKGFGDGGRKQRRVFV